jgi:hypothetical protein
MKTSKDFTRDMTWAVSEVYIITDSPGRLIGHLYFFGNGSVNRKLRKKSKLSALAPRRPFGFPKLGRLVQVIQKQA